MILTILIVFLSLVVLVTLHELGHFILAKKFGVKVEEFGFGIPPRVFGKRFGETIYSINLLPIGAFVKLYGEDKQIKEPRSFNGKPIWQRVLIVFGGVVAFWIVAIVLFSIVFAIGVEIPISDEDGQNLINPRVLITAISPGSPAQNGGLKIGDVIIELKLGAEQLKVDRVGQVQEFTEIHKGKEIILTIQREKETFDISLVPRLSPPENEGPIGVGLGRVASIIEKYTWYQAPFQGIFYCGKLTIRTVSGLIKIFGDIFQGKGVSPEVGLAGPLGVTVFLARAVELGLGFFFYIIGVIAVFLALFNLLPIPALDGGKLLFLAIEKIKRKPISTKIEQNITLVFFSLLIILVIFVTIKFDIPRFLEFIKSGF